MTDGKLWSVEVGTSAQIMVKIMRVLLPDAVTVLDLTYGDGGFWTPETIKDLGISVRGIDINPDKDTGEGMCSVADFRATGLRDGSIDVGVFDPPHLTDTGEDSAMGIKYGEYATIPELRDAVMQGTAEAWRISRFGIVVKVIDYVHGNRFVEMTQWVRDVVPVPPYQRIESYRVKVGANGELSAPTKMTDPKWEGQLSAYLASATYLVFRKGSQIHKRRKRETEAVPQLRLVRTTASEPAAGAVAGVKRERRR